MFPKIPQDQTAFRVFQQCPKIATRLPRTPRLDLCWLLMVLASGNVAKIWNFHHLSSYFSENVGFVKTGLPWKRNWYFEGSDPPQNLKKWIRKRKKRIHALFLCQVVLGESRMWFLLQESRGLLFFTKYIYFFYFLFILFVLLLFLSFLMWYLQLGQ